MKSIYQNSFLFIAVSLFMTFPGTCQNYKLNFGLQQPQAPSTLPLSAAKPQVSLPKAKIHIPPVAEKISANRYLINKGWELATADKVTASGKSVFAEDLNTGNWYNATVPGTVLTTLVDQGVFPDPYYGLNNLSISDSISRTDGWYRLMLPLPENTQGKLIWLLFEGINYRADIWLNGHLLGKMTGAFIRGEFNATPFIKPEGKNILAVHVYPPNNPGIPHEESSRTNSGPNGGQLCLDGPTFISSEGWDWVPGIRGRNTGIWQDVILRLTGKVTLSDPQIITDLPLPDTSKATITIKTMLKNRSDKAQKALISGAIGSVTFSKNVDLEPGETKQVVFSPSAFRQLEMANPRLWWPNGYGRQELYLLDLNVFIENNLSDQVESRFGVREYSYELGVADAGGNMRRVEYNPLQTAGKVLFNNIDRVEYEKGTWLPKLASEEHISLLTITEQNSSNPFLTLKVNGIPVFCKGGNWGMDDGMKRVSRERLEPYFRLHREAHFNMVRNWTGENTEQLFYDLCDEYGMMVWNDFWLSTEGYNLEVNDNRLFMANATDVVKRFRNHPSIAIWCPRNEGYAPVQTEPLLAAMIAWEDGTRYYAPNSRYLNLRPSGPWHYLTDPSEYYRTIAEGFNTELGTPSVPTAATIRSFIPAEDQWPVSDTWYYHDFHEGLIDYVKTIDNRYGKCTNLDDFCKKAQLINYDSHRAMFESWNSKLWNRASGILLWMSHPAWPSMVWQTYSWDYETHGSWFGARKACEPVHIQMNLDDSKVVIVNTSLKNLTGLTAKAEIFGLGGNRLASKSVNCGAPANSLTPCFTLQLPPALPDVYLVRLTLLSGQKPVSQNDYWQGKTNGSFDDFNKTAPAKLDVLITGKDQSRITFTVSNKSKVPAIGLKFNLKEGRTGRIVLPAWFSDGYINLMPGEKKLMTVDFSSGNNNDFQISWEAYNMPD